MALILSQLRYCQFLLMYQEAQILSVSPSIYLTVCVSDIVGVKIREPQLTLFRQTTTLSILIKPIQTYMCKHRKESAQCLTSKLLLFCVFQYSSLVRIVFVQQLFLDHHGEVDNKCVIITTHMYFRVSKVYAAHIICQVTGYTSIIGNTVCYYIFYSSECLIGFFCN